MFTKSIITAAAASILAALALAPAAQAGGCAKGSGYSSYQSTSYSYRAQRKAAARRAAKARRIAAARRAAKAKAIAKAKAAEKKAEKVAEAKPAPVQSVSKTLTKVSTTKAEDTKVEIAEAKPTCRKFVATVGTTIEVPCGQ